MGLTGALSRVTRRPSAAILHKWEADERRTDPFGTVLRLSLYPTSTRMAHAMSLGDGTGLLLGEDILPVVVELWGVDEWHVVDAPR